jgi:hypothetical protein
LIHFWALLIAPASFTGLVFTFLLPGIAQAYWLWELWPAAGALSLPLPVMCAAWLALLGSGSLYGRCSAIDPRRDPVEGRWREHRTSAHNKNPGLAPGVFISNNVPRRRAV